MELRRSCPSTRLRLNSFDPLTLLKLLKKVERLIASSVYFSQNIEKANSHAKCHSHVTVVMSLPSSTTNDIIKSVSARTQNTYYYLIKVRITTMVNLEDFQLNFATTD